MFKKIWDTIKAAAKKAIDAVSNVFNKLKDWIKEDGNADTVMDVCAVVMTIATVAIVVRLFMPLRIVSEPVVKMAIPLSALLALKKGGADA